jgi:hypothetical protein
MEFRNRRHLLAGDKGFQTRRGIRASPESGKDRLRLRDLTVFPPSQF